MLIFGVRKLGRARSPADNLRPRPRTDVADPFDPAGRSGDGGQTGRTKIVRGRFGGGGIRRWRWRGRTAKRRDRQGQSQQCSTPFHASISSPRKACQGDGDDFQLRLEAPAQGSWPGAMMFPAGARCRRADAGDGNRGPDRFGSGDSWKFTPCASARRPRFRCPRKWLR